MEGELIAVSFISSIFMLVGIMLLNRNWFQKERFKLEKSNLQAQNRIQIKRMEKELGLTPSRQPKEAPTGNILDLIKNLDRDKIENILELLGGGEGETEGEAPTDTLIRMVNENPEIISKFLGGVKEKNTGNTGDKYL